MKIVITDSFYKSLDKLSGWKYHIGQLWYNVKCSLWNRYTTVKPRSLPHTWTDRDTLMAHTMFEILEQFIEKECSPGVVDWYYIDKEYGHTKKIEVNGTEVFIIDEMKELVRWWNDSYLPYFRGEIVNEPVSRIEFDRFIELVNDNSKCTEEEKKYFDYLDDLNKQKHEMEEELNKRLQRILKIREYMWT